MSWEGKGVGGGAGEGSDLDQIRRRVNPRIYKVTDGQRVGIKPAHDIKQLRFWVCVSFFQMRTKCRFP